MTMDAGGSAEDRATGDVPHLFTFKGVQYVVRNNTAGPASVGEGPGQTARPVNATWLVWRCDAQGKHVKDVGTFEGEPGDEDIGHLIGRAQKFIDEQ